MVNIFCKDLSSFLQDNCTVIRNVSKAAFSENVKIAPKISSNCILFEKYAGNNTFRRMHNNMVYIFCKN